MFRSLWETGRLPAFLVHVVISALLVATLAVPTWLVWYPPPYFWWDGGWQVLRLVAAVDVVLGPLLTLIVFRRGKKSLKSDLAIIGGIQLAAFIYGAVVLVQYRPAFLVYAPKNFYSVPWPEVSAFTRDKARIEAMRGGSGATTVVLELPAERAEADRIRAEVKKAGARVTLLGDYYQPLTPERWQRILPESVNLAAQVKEQPELQGDMDAFSAKFLGGRPMNFNDYAYYPGVFRYGVVMYVMDRNKGSVVGWLSD